MHCMLAALQDERRKKNEPSGETKTASTNASIACLHEARLVSGDTVIADVCIEPTSYGHYIHSTIDIRSASIITAP